MIDGDINDVVWDAADWTTDFIDISGVNFPKPAYTTKVKMLWDDSTLYLAAYIQEPHLWATLTEDESVIFYDNDFEVFIDPNGDNHDYFEFEFNAFNTKWDLFLPFPYRDLGKPDVNWNCKNLRSAVQLYGSINDAKGAVDSAWTIEIAIPFSSLNHLLQMTWIPSVGDEWRINFSRVQWDLVPKKTGYDKKNKVENNWVWSPQGSINMHQPEFWGYLHFVNRPTIVTESFSDKYWSKKQLLMSFYAQQRKYHKTHKTYSNELFKGIAFNDKIIYLPNSDGYYASIESDSLIHFVNQLGRLWSIPKYSKLPKYWVWHGGQAKFTFHQWDSLFADLHNIGIQGILINAPASQFNEIIPIAKVYGIQVDAWVWTLNRGDAPDSLMSVNALEQSLAEVKAYVGYYKFMSPGLKSTKDFIEITLEPYTMIPDLGGIHLDYIRYVDVVLPIALQPKYNLVQDHIMPEFDYGYHSEMVAEYLKISKKKVSSYQQLSQDSQWIQFRMDKVTQIVNEIVLRHQKLGIKTSAAVFPDVIMAQEMVSQDWQKWNINYCFPMIYHNFYNEDVSWIKKEVMINRAAMPEQIIFAGLYLPALNNPLEFEKAMQFAFDGGANGIALFDLKAMNMTQKRVLEKFIKQNP